MISGSNRSISPRTQRNLSVLCV